MVKIEDNVEREAHHKQGSQVYTKTKTIMTKVMQLDIDKDGKTQLIYTDGTGRFPKHSRTGQNYIMVLAENDSDAILVKRMKNRSAGEMVRAYKYLLNDCTRAESSQPNKCLTMKSQTRTKKQSKASRSNMN